MRDQENVNLIPTKSCIAFMFEFVTNMYPGNFLRGRPYLIYQERFVRYTPINLPMSRLSFPQFSALQRFQNAAVSAKPRGEAPPQTQSRETQTTTMQSKKATSYD